MIWHSEQIDRVKAELGVDFTSGLSEGDIRERIEKYGLNKLAEKAKKTYLQRFIDQLKDVMIIILLAAAAVSVAISLYNVSNGGEADWIEPIVIVFVVIVNGILGVMQESKAEAALDALREMSMPHVKVRRSGAAQVISSEYVTVGDVILLEAGDIIPADCRVFEAAALKSNESALTGESLPVEKSATPVSESAPLADRTDMLYSGTSITYGRGEAVVTATGMSTEIGHIAELIAGETKSTTPLQERLAELGKYLGIGALVICAIVFVVGVMQGLPIMEMFMTAISLAVAAIPEGLPATVTIVLAMGVRRMVMENAIIRRLPAVETLGGTSVICSDKTGTLTQNKMTLVKGFVREIEPIDGGVPDDIRALLKLGTLCTDGAVELSEGEEKHVGDPTETSIVAAALHIGMTKDALASECPRVGEIPFDSDRKLMTTINKIDGRLIVIVKGAPDVLFGRCVKGSLDAARAANEEMSASALRVLAIARKEIDSLPDKFGSDDLENGLELIGLLGMIDPPREEAVAAIAECDMAGIKTVMITGDHVITASAIAKEIGILREGGGALSGAELSALSDDELYEKVPNYRVYARVSPSDKIRIVKAWQRHNQVVAMTGDGVNDAPALQAADIGCAMGITGTEVAKGASDMVLTDDNFATIVSAVREGRGIYDNIRKAVRFLLSTNLGEIITVFIAMIIWRESPLMPIQILWINLVTDSFPALALGMESIEPGVMKRAPRCKDESIFANGMGTATVVQGIMIGVITLIAYYIGTRSSLNNAGIPLGETMAFAVLGLSQLVHVMNVRSSESIFKIGFFSNPYMVKAVGVSGILMLSTVCVPILQRIFKTVPMNLAEWCAVATLALVPLAACEAGKLLLRVRGVR